MAREIVDAACKRAGYPSMGAAELRAAYGYWLRCQGISDHQVAQVLGLARVSTVDALLRRHLALDAQRRVREHG